MLLLLKYRRPAQLPGGATGAHGDLHFNGDVYLCTSTYSSSSAAAAGKAAAGANRTAAPTPPAAPCVGNVSSGGPASVFVTSRNASAQLQIQPGIGQRASVVLRMRQSSNGAVSLTADHRRVHYLPGFRKSAGRACSSLQAGAAASSVIVALAPDATAAANTLVERCAAACWRHTDCISFEVLRDPLSPPERCVFSSKCRSPNLFGFYFRHHDFYTQRIPNDIRSTDVRVARLAWNPLASRSVRRALLTPQVHPGSLYRRGKSV